MKLKIYFAGSITGRRCYIHLFATMVGWLKKLGVKVLSEHVADRSMTSFGERKRLSDREIFDRDKRLIEAADCVVAEVSQPSHGVGGEIVYALMKKKPVLALFYKEAKDLLSSMIAGNPSDNLYLEHYDEDNLKIILKNFLAHVKNNYHRKGRLIVIEGGDGSGKTTQAKLLINFLKKKRKKVKYMDFPRYYSSFHGKIVGDFLAGKFGKMSQISPYLISLAYALDRASAKEEMEEWLSGGGIIISNRYATSNMAHQTARLPQKEREKFLEWLDQLEYRVHKIPRPDLVIFLYVPWKIGMRLTATKVGERRYVKGADIAEKDIKHRQEAEKMYLWLAKNKRKWVKIDCCQNDKILPKKVIHDRIVEVLKERKVIK